MPLYTLIFVKDSKRLLLGKKRRGDRIGIYNGFGGKIELNETVAEAAQRELKEESHLDVELSNLKYLGVVIATRDKINHVIHIFVVQWGNVVGNPEESDEMTPEWFELCKLPWNEMEPDNRYWIQNMIDEVPFKAQFWYEDDRLLKTSVEILEQFPNYEQNWF